MTRAPSTKPLFRALSGQAAPAGEIVLPIEAPPARRQRDEARRADDFYPTVQPCAIRALLAYDGALIRDCGAVWEPCVGAGDLAREIEAFGLPVIGSDLRDRGWPGTIVRSYYDWDASPARAIITNPPYDQINARDGSGRWLRHTLDMPGWDYLALLLSWDWPAAVKNGLGALLDDQPFSRAWLIRWKIDFTGDGSPPQRNAWFVWDRRDRRGPGTNAPHPDFRWMDRRDWRQDVLL